MLVACAGRQVGKQANSTFSCWYHGPDRQQTDTQTDYHHVSTLIRTDLCTFQEPTKSMQIINYLPAFHQQTIPDNGLFSPRMAIRTCLLRPGNILANQPNGNATNNLIPTFKSLIFFLISRKHSRLPVGPTHFWQRSAESPRMLVTRLGSRDVCDNPLIYGSWLLDVHGWCFFKAKTNVSTNNCGKCQIMPWCTIKCLPQVMGTKRPSPVSAINHGSVQWTSESGADPLTWVNSALSSNGDIIGHA